MCRQVQNVAYPWKSLPTQTLCQLSLGNRPGLAGGKGTLTQHPLGLTPALACPGAVDKSYLMEATVAVGLVVTGCVGMGGGVGRHPGTVGPNFMSAMLLDRRETWTWLCCQALKSCEEGKEMCRERDPDREKWQ